MVARVEALYPQSLAGRILEGVRGGRRAEQEGTTPTAAASSRLASMAGNPDHDVSGGSLPANYVQSLFATASAHTVYSVLVIPYVMVSQVEDEFVSLPISTLPLPSILDEIKTMTELPKRQIAEELIGVSREAYDNWANGLGISPDNERRVRTIHDVVRRATRRLRDSSSVRGWLLTPVGSKALVPIDLLREGRADEARLLAMSYLPPRSRPLPDVLLHAPVDTWSQRQFQRRNKVTIDPYDTSRHDDL